MHHLNVFSHTKVWMIRKVRKPETFVDDSIKYFFVHEKFEMVPKVTFHWWKIWIVVPQKRSPKTFVDASIHGILFRKWKNWNGIKKQQLHKWKSWATTQREDAWIFCWCITYEKKLKWYPIPAFSEEKVGMVPKLFFSLIKKLEWYPNSVFSSVFLNEKVGMVPKLLFLLRFLRWKSWNGTQIQFSFPFS